MRAEPPFRADHVGSLLHRPQRLLDARASFAEGAIPAAQLRAIEDDAITEAVAQQEAAGLQSATDGEFRRASWHNRVIEPDLAAHVQRGRAVVTADRRYSKLRPKILLHRRGQRPYHRRAGRQAAPGGGDGGRGVGLRGGSGAGAPAHPPWLRSRSASCTARWNAG